MECRILHKVIFDLLGRKELLQIFWHRNDKIRVLKLIACSVEMWSIWGSELERQKGKMFPSCGLKKA